MNLLKWSVRQKPDLLSSLMGRRVVFHHVPKCAGTSVSRALRKRYLLSRQSIDASATVKAAAENENFASLQEYDQVRRFRQQLLTYFLLQDHFFIGGHIPFHRDIYQRFGRGHLLMTVLRDPVQRFLSEYFYNYLRNDHARLTESLEEYLETDLARRNGMKYCDYFWGGDGFPLEDPSAAAEQAKISLRQFKIVGFVDRMGDFERAVHSKLGIRVQFGLKNVGTKKLADEQIPTATRLKIEKLCRYDSEIYEFARRVFG